MKYEGYCGPRRRAHEEIDITKLCDVYWQVLDKIILFRSLCICETWAPNISVIEILCKGTFHYYVHGFDNFIILVSLKILLRGEI